VPALGSFDQVGFIHGGYFIADSGRQVAIYLKGGYNRPILMGSTEVMNDKQNSHRSVLIIITCIAFLCLCLCVLTIGGVFAFRREVVPGRAGPRPVLAYNQATETRSPR